MASLKGDQKSLVAKNNEADVRMSVEDLRAAFAAPSFAGRQLVTV